MKIVLLGSTGATGKYVVRQALEAGHEVASVVRDARRASPAHAGVQVVEGALSDPGTLDRVMPGASAVISTLGVARSSPSQLPSAALEQILAAMKRHGVQRYLGMSGAGVTMPGEKKPLVGALISFAVKHLTPAVFQDKKHELEVLLRSDIQWVLIRPPRLVDGEPTGRYLLDLDKPHGNKVARGDVADALLRQLRSDEFLRRAPYIATP